MSRKPYVKRQPGAFKADFLNDFVDPPMMYRPFTFLSLNDRLVPEEVRRQVLERLEIFSKDGGYVFNTIHNIQANTPIENIAAMIEAVKEFNGDR